MCIFFSVLIGSYRSVSRVAPLAVAQEQPLEQVMKTIVEGISRSEVAFARVWSVEDERGLLFS